MKHVSKPVQGYLESNHVSGGLSISKFFGGFKTFALLLALAFTSSFAEGIESLQSEVTTRIAGLEAAIIAIGVILVGVAVIIGAVRLFRNMGKSVG